MASSTVSVVFRVTGLGVMQSLTRRRLSLVGVDTNTRDTPEPENASVKRKFVQSTTRNDNRQAKRFILGDRIETRALSLL